jgi:glutathione S-transferase
MLTLRSSPASPFGRKIKIAASLLDLIDRIEVVEADTSNPDDSLRQQNPLGKIPTLVLENGETLYDSRVILEYLDDLAGGGHIFPSGWDRFAALRQQALADGIMDAVLIQVYEGRWRTEERREPKWVDHHAGKVARGLDYAEANLSTPTAKIHVGHIALACALGYLDLRMAGRWRDTHPRLVAWLADFEARVPMFGKTTVKP